MTENAGSKVIPDRLLSIGDVAEWLRIPVRTLYQWRYRQEGPPTLKVGKHLRYRATDVEAWLETCRSDAPAFPTSWRG